MEGNKKRILEELSDKGCIEIKDKQEKLITVCVGTKEDMGRRIANLI
ncbi:hypothetical protein HYU07_02090 [Candidatus Woesearchaeota archaeon]|nr:hypothetical protein [Candidatus Woesearchaeota archaeon]